VPGKALLLVRFIPQDRMPPGLIFSVKKNGRWSLGSASHFVAVPLAIRSGLNIMKQRGK
jgi:hypothetical protein